MEIVLYVFLGALAALSLWALVQYITYCIRKRRITTPRRNYSHYPFPTPRSSGRYPWGGRKDDIVSRLSDMERLISDTYDLTSDVLVTTERTEDKLSPVCDIIMQNELARKEKDKVEKLDDLVNTVIVMANDSKTPVEDIRKAILEGVHNAEES